MRSVQKKKKKKEYMHFTLNANPLRFEDPEDFIKCYNPENTKDRKETERLRCFTYDELIQRDKVNLDIFRLKDESLEDSENLPEPDMIAAELVENHQSAMGPFRSIYPELESGTFSVAVYNSDGSYKDMAANVMGASSDSTIIRGSGNYYLAINADEPYEITVESQK